MIWQRARAFFFIFQSFLCSLLSMIIEKAPCELNPIKKLVQHLLEEKNLLSLKKVVSGMLEMHFIVAQLTQILNFSRVESYEFDACTINFLSNFFYSNHKSVNNKIPISSHSKPRLD